MKVQIIEGTIQGNANGYGFLLPSDSSLSDFFIPHGDLRGALHGDRVLCETRESYGERTCARVLKIIERGTQTLTGTYFTCRGGGYVVPDEKRFSIDVFIPFGKGLRAKAGDKVVCRILSYPKKQRPEGIITKIFGRQYEKSAQLKSIFYTYKMPEKFKKDAVWEANDLSLQINEQTLKDRTDFRDLITFTIDGDNAKDFDDAISIEKTKTGYILYVHIADVSHYVKKGGKIDREAFERGTSAYFPEVVFPMLPEKLCNDLCSLKEGVDRLTLSCVMQIDKFGKVVDGKIVQSVINSNKRLTYSIVQKILDGDKGLKKEYNEVYKQLKIAEQLADILTQRSREQGTIDLDVKDSVITCQKGEIIVEREVRDKAHKIIEEFMILANTVVAEYAYYLELPFLYRVHEKPSEERLQNFYDFLEGLGLKPKRKKDQVFPKDFQLILQNAQDKDYFYLVNRVMLRSMQKAKYLPDNLGHFGLSLSCYTHFTSPIRRYPDLVVHRILKAFIKDGINGVKEFEDSVYEIAEQSSLKEKNATEAERAVDDFYKLLYLSGEVGSEFDGIISGVTKFGLFVELENGVEGLVKVESLRSRKVDFNPKTYTLVCGKQAYRLGQRLRIKVLEVNFDEKRAEFVILKDNSCKSE